MLTAEIAIPELPAVAALLGAVVLFIAWLIATGALTLWRRSLGALLTWLADTIDGVSIDIPHITTIKPLAPLAAALRSLVDTVDHYLGEAVHWSEKGAVTLFKFFTAINVWMAKELAALATDTWQGLVAVRSGLKAEVEAWTRAVFGYVIHKLTVALDQVLHHDLPRVNSRVARVEQAERFHHRETTAAIASQGVRVGITSRQMRRLARRMSRVEKATLGLGAVALVATALGRMKLGWLRCPSLLRMGRSLGCIGFDWLEGFFATTFEALVVLDLCQFALAAQRLARFIVPQLAGTLLVQNAVCLGGGASLPSAHDSPKTITKITLPSAHD